MREMIYANQKHKQTIENYLLMCKEFVKESSTKIRYKNYLEVIDLILEYHNSYGSGTKEHNFFDWPSPAIANPSHSLDPPGL